MDNQESHILSEALTDTISQIRELYESQFDRPWFSVFLEDFPLDSQSFQDIHYLFTIHLPTRWDIPVINRGIVALENYVELVRELVLPHVSRMFTSGENIKLGRMSLDMRVQRKLVASVLPKNLERLEGLLNELKLRVEQEKTSS